MFFWCTQMDELTVGRVLFAGSDANVHVKKKSEGEGEGGQSPLKGGSKHKVDKHASEDVATADADAGSPAVRHSRKGLGAFSLSPKQPIFRIHLLNFLHISLQWRH